MIPTLCTSLEELDEPEAKASLIWILGEYASKIDNADELIGSFLDNYAEEPIQVRSLCFLEDVTDKVRVGPTASVDGGRETVPSKTRGSSSPRPTSTGARNQDCRLARLAGSSVHPMATSLFRYGGCQGASRPLSAVLQSD